MRREHCERLVVLGARGRLRRARREAEVGALSGLDYAVDGAFLAQVLLAEIRDQRAVVTRDENRLPWLPHPGATTLIFPESGSTETTSFAYSVDPLR